MVEQPADAPEADPSANELPEEWQLLASSEGPAVALSFMADELRGLLLRAGDIPRALELANAIIGLTPQIARALGEARDWTERRKTLADMVAAADEQMARAKAAYAGIVGVPKRRDGELHAEAIAAAKREAAKLLSLPRHATAEAVKRRAQDHWQEAAAAVVRMVAATSLEPGVEAHCLADISRALEDGRTGSLSLWLQPGGRTKAKGEISGEQLAGIAACMMQAAKWGGASSKQAAKEVAAYFAGHPIAVTNTAPLVATADTISRWYYRLGVDAKDALEAAMAERGQSVRRREWTRFHEWAAASENGDKHRPAPWWLRRVGGDPRKAPVKSDVAAWKGIAREAGLSIRKILGSSVPQRTHTSSR